MDKKHKVALAAEGFILCYSKIQAKASRFAENKIPRHRPGKKFVGLKSAKIDPWSAINFHAS